MRKLTITLALVPLLWSGISLAQHSYPYCQILDGTDYPAWRVRAAYVSSAEVDVEEGKDVAIWKVDGGGGIYFWRTEVGEIDLTGDYELRAWDGSGGINLPNQTAVLRLRTDYIYRRWDGSAVRLSVMPGFYTDVDEWSFDSFFIPLEVTGIQAFNPQISGLLGLAVYPGFERAFDPRFGVRFAPIEEVRIDLMYPESRVVFRPVEEWETFAGIRHEAVNEYRLPDSDGRRLLAYRETSLYAGVAWPVFEGVRATAELGYVFNREVDFARGATARDIDEAWMIRFGLVGDL